MWCHERWLPYYWSVTKDFVNSTNDIFNAYLRFYEVTIGAKRNAALTLVLAR